VNTNTAFNAIIARSGKTKANISRELGKNPNYINTHITNARKSLNTTTLAAVANVCNYDLLLRNRTTGDEIVIDPPE